VTTGEEDEIGGATTNDVRVRVGDSMEFPGRMYIGLVLNFPEIDNAP